MRLSPKAVKNILRSVRDSARNQVIHMRLNERGRSTAISTIDGFDYSEFRINVLHFLRKIQDDQSVFEYKYSESRTKTTLYASAYACMTLSLLDELAKLSQQNKERWVLYFDSFQSEVDGLFYDSVVQNEFYDDSDWWGARHLALHMIGAYTDLEAKPKTPFRFLENYYQRASIHRWLDDFDWSSPSIGDSDIDNKIMNIGCLLQYQRDNWNDDHAEYTIDKLKAYLKSKINTRTGMWGGFDELDPHQRSRMVQFAYHLMLVFFYDKDFSFDAERIVGLVLSTQNKHGGYGTKPNSSACEDIDSIDILLRLRQFCSIDVQRKIDQSIHVAFKWILLNQVQDGGFVFRLYEPFIYGSEETSSTTNEGAIFPTWFRTLSIAYISHHLAPKHGFKLNNCPGYEFQ